MSKDFPDTPSTAVYSVDKLMAETRRLAAEYRRMTGQTLAVSGEIARYDAARLLDLRLEEARVGCIDAIGRGQREGKRIQIKGRVIFDEHKSGHRIGELGIEAPWDAVLLVLMDSDYEPYEIYEAEREDVLAALAEASRSRRSKRGALSVAKFKAVSALAWTRERGEEDEVWSNQP
jgi:hypothetical protein